MNKVIALLFAISLPVFADTVVPYNTWTNLDYCGGQTRLICADEDNARQNNHCYIEFRTVSYCNRVQMYMSYEYNSTPDTFVDYLQNGFYYSSYRPRLYVDNSKVRNNTFNTKLDGSGRFDNLRYQFGY